MARDKIFAYLDVLKRSLKYYLSFPAAPFAVLTFLVFVIYARTLWFDYTYLDDNVLILGQLPFLQHFSNIWTVFKQDVFSDPLSAAYYRPLLTISFMIDAHLHSDSLAIFHLTNIVLHMIVVCMVYVLLTRFGFEKRWSFLGSALFAVHPALSQAVAWVPGRNDTLMAVFVLSAFLAYIRYQEEDDKVYLAAHSSLFFLALLTKETSLVLLFIIVLLWLLFHRQDWRQRLLPILVFDGVAIVLWGIFRYQVLAQSQLHFTLAEMLRSLWHGVPAIWQFYGKLLIPFHLSVLPVIPDMVNWLGLSLLAATALLFWRYKKLRSLWMLFNCVWFLAFLVPSFVRPDSSRMPDYLEHRAYVAYIGLLIALLEVVRTIGRPHEKQKQWGFGMMIVLFAVVTFVRLPVFAHRINFWQNAVATSPSYPLAHRNLGAMYYLDGKYDSAQAEYEKTLALNDAEPMVHNNLGLIYAAEGKVLEAEKEYRRELEVNPGYANAMFNLASLYYGQARYDDAIHYWQETLKVNPDDVQSWQGIIVAEFQKGNRDEAWRKVLAAESQGVVIDASLRSELAPKSGLQFK